jgi:carboxypeptidase Taq
LQRVALATESKAYEAFAERIGEYWDLYKIYWLLGWDQRTMMPPGGAAARADQLATVTRIMYERLTADEVGELLEELRDYEESLDYGSDEASLIRFTRREYDKFRRVPPELRGEMARAAAQALAEWDDAKEESDFARMLPHLKRAFDLRREYVACFEPAENDYDHLLDEFEPGMTTAEVTAVFGKMKAELVPLIAAIAERPQVDDSFLAGPWPIDGQKGFETKVLERFGFVPDSWRLDETGHPFASSASPTDIRITTRHRLDDLHSVFSCMHEFGHGLYEHQVSPSIARTPLARGTSLGIHESQSRMWENLVGRSRPFWRRFYPELQRAFPERLGGVEAETFYRAINKVQPTLIRIESDEATYNLHIILRFELEQDLLDGKVEVEDAADAWNARMKEYLGVDVPDHAHGILQDMHWSAGHIGYFSTYSLGNIVSVQLWERIRAEIPDLDDQIERAEFAALREWLRENVHRHGRKFMSKELLQRVVGSSIDSGPYLKYLRAKFGEIYGL